MKMEHSLVGILLALAFAEASVFAADSKRDAEERKASSVTSLQLKASQVQSPAIQPVRANEIIPTALMSPLAGEQLKWQVLSGGGNRGTSTNYGLSGSVGQTAIGLGASTGSKINSGFWQNFSGGGSCCVGVTGNVDCDSDGGVDISDVSVLIDNLFMTFTPLCCNPSANTDGDSEGGVDISDLSILIDHLFLSFAPTAACQ